MSRHPRRPRSSASCQGGPTKLAQCLTGIGLLATTLGVCTTAVPVAAAVGPQDVSIRAVTTFAPPDYEPSALTFRSEGAITTTGTWDFPEGKGGAVSVVDLTFTSADGTFVIRVHSRRTLDAFDPQTCTGYAEEQGHWQLRGGTDAYADVRGHGELAGLATYFGEGDPGRGCEGVSERLALNLTGAITR